MQWEWISRIKKWICVFRSKILINIILGNNYSIILYIGQKQTHILFSR
jgi:hypothetical protein